MIKNELVTVTVMLHDHLSGYNRIEKHSQHHLLDSDLDSLHGHKTWLWKHSQAFN